ncbi:hypothetical protein KJA13_01510 [Patescibacteria group bacterium]|nr:hypothetical protein [Patescibacteria group bacterium]
MVLRRNIIIISLIILILVIGFVVFKEGLKEEEKEQEAEQGISLEEKQQIEAWIEENNLNQYGDPKDTVYTGGTPLFNEKTGERIDKYEYILRKHPDRPWLR